MTRITRNTTLLLLCLVSGAALAGQRGGGGAPDIDRCRIVNGAVTGKYADNRIKGEVHGDLRGELDCDVRADLDPLSGTVRLGGRGKLTTERGVLITVDDVRLVPSAEPSVMIWMGYHKVRGADGAFRGIEGTMISEGLLDTKTGELKYEFKAIMCPTD